ncbi:PDZ domain-containing protein [Hydrogenimonas thermophila]|uniref:PDZ domain-containing protein n=1 Tax=Hydrogenimonas thermophila TaxID=223786 RepID=A0A1I5RBI8_9BACT|nr:PDZ domain-containing protein [Hydrogenimonas thermophila]SFP55904.1 PDZ domain-containing protein [Hydrogenimonas thermophila]
MKIWLLLIFFLYSFPTLIFANECKRFFPGSLKVIDGYPTFAVAKDRFISLKCPNNKKIIAYDRFKGLCLFQDTTKKPFYLAKHRTNFFFCQSDKPKSVTILSYPSSIYPGLIKESVKKRGALFGECCHLAGVVDINGEWYDVTSIKKLLKKDTKHSDIGIRFSVNEKYTVVKRVDPFVNSPLLPGDKVIKINKIKNPTLKQVRDRVDSCKVGRKIFIEVKRNKRLLSYRVNCFKRVGGGKVSDTFLEHLGIWFDKNLVITNIDKSGAGYKSGLRKGDKLLKIDESLVYKQVDVQKVMSNYAVKKSMPNSMLWERDGFQFFLSTTSI